MKEDRKLLLKWGLENASALYFGIEASGQKAQHLKMRKGNDSCLRHSCEEWPFCLLLYFAILNNCGFLEGSILHFFFGSAQELNPFPAYIETFQLPGLLRCCLDLSPHNPATE